MVKCNAITIDNKRIKIRPKALKDMNNAENIDKIISKIKTRIDKEIPDTGYFRNFAEDFQNTDKNLYARACSLSVQRDETIDGQALLLANVLHPSMNIESSVMLRCGNRQELLDYIENSSFKDELMQSFKELSNSLKNN